MSDSIGGTTVPSYDEGCCEGETAIFHACLCCQKGLQATSGGPTSVWERVRQEEDIVDSPAVPCGQFFGFRHEAVNPALIRFSKSIFSLT